MSERHQHTWHTRQFKGLPSAVSIHFAVYLPLQAGLQPAWRPALVDLPVERDQRFRLDVPLQLARALEKPV